MVCFIAYKFNFSSVRGSVCNFLLPKVSLTWSQGEECFITGLETVTSEAAEKHPRVMLELLPVDSDLFTSCGHGNDLHNIGDKRHWPGRIRFLIKNAKLAWCISRWNGTYSNIQPSTVCACECVLERIKKKKKLSAWYPPLGCSNFKVLEVLEMLG